MVACKTASAFALDANYGTTLTFPLSGVIESRMPRWLLPSTRNKRVGIIGTVGTVGSGIHAEYLRKTVTTGDHGILAKASVRSFVPLVEEGWLHDPVTTRGGGQIT